MNSFHKYSQRFHASALVHTINSLIVLQNLFLGKEITAGNGRFLITKVMKRHASKWDGFDSDTMDKGVTIMWNKSHIRRNLVHNGEKAGTESKSPTLLESKKRKRQPEQWKSNKRKQAVRSGQEFSYKVKQKDGKVVQKNSQTKRNETTLWREM